MEEIILNKEQEETVIDFAIDYMKLFCKVYNFRDESDFNWEDYKRTYSVRFRRMLKDGRYWKPVNDIK